MPKQTMRSERMIKAQSISDSAMATGGPTAGIQQQLIVPRTAPQEQNGEQTTKRHHPDANQSTDDDMEDDDWITAGCQNKKPRTREGAEGVVQESTAQTKVGEFSVLKLKFLDQSVQANLIHDKATTLKLLNSSPFAGTYEGSGRKLSSKHELILNIIDATKVKDLLKIKYLEEGETKWPIEVSLIETNQSAKVYGVMKIHPLVPDHRIQEELERKENANLERGCIISL